MTVIGKNLLRSNELCQSLFESLIKMYQKVPKVYEIYGNFMKLVLNNEKDSEKLIST